MNAKMPRHTNREQLLLQLNATCGYQRPVITIAVMADSDSASRPFLQAKLNQKLVSFRQLA